MLAEPMPATAIAAVCLSGLLQGPPLQRSWWDRTDPASVGLVNADCLSARSDLPADVIQWVAPAIGTACARAGGFLGDLPLRSKPCTDADLFQFQRDYTDTVRLRRGFDVRSRAVVFGHGAQGTGLFACVEGVEAQRFVEQLAGEVFAMQSDARFGSDLPAWARAGLAAHFELGGDSTVGAGAMRTPAVVEQLRAALSGSAQIALTDLLARDRRRWGSAIAGSEDAMVAAVESWALVEFLLSPASGNWRGCFQQMLRLLASGASGETAFTDAFGKRESVAPALEADWQKWCASLVPDPVAETADRLEFLAAGTRELIRRGESVGEFARLHDRLREIDFRWRVERGPAARELAAADDANFKPAGGTGSFELVPPRKPLNRRRDSEGPVVPPVIHTRDTQPELSIEWVRAAEAGQWTWLVRAAGK